jgi:bifunctional DNA-binding transcriptional regulator/antitoxin component of YhaV-PrlF toxin-antitoxin module
MEKENVFVDELHREVKVQCSKPKNRVLGQFFIQIPKEIVRELEIKKGDVVVIDVPLKNKNNYSIKFKKKIK